MDLKSLLKNKWMTNTTFITQAAHALLTAFAIIVCAYFTKGIVPPLIAAGVAFVYAVVKEFIYDANEEVPVQTSFDNWLDFTFLCLGTAIGLGLVCLKMFVLN